METVTLSTKGQLVIPASVRGALVDADVIRTAVAHHLARL